jgi:transcription termination factor Rho
MAGENDIYVSPSQIRKYRLSSGDLVQGRIRISGENERYDALLYVEKINDKIPEVNVNRPDFEKLVAIFPDVKMRLETSQDVISTRILDIFAPIGKGQRGMIVSSPKAGKTILLKQIAKSVRANHPDVKLIILLIDERPEEVTDMQRSIECDVIYSTFDQKPSNHIKAAEIVLERAKRLVESGADVMILVDSITRLARANNLVVPPSGRTLSGGLDPESLYFPKKFFGSARNIENGGSLTIIATALVETGSRMDDMIFEEFKGTGNMEVHLERSIAESRIYPAINIPRSGTRREDLLLTDQVMAAEFGLRKAFSGAGPNAFIDNIIQHLRKTPSNKAFVEYVLKNYLTN